MSVADAPDPAEGGQLLGVPPDQYGESWTGDALDLYGRYLGTAETTRSLRGHANTYLLSANSLLLSLSGVLLTVTDEDTGWLVAIPIAGLLLTVAWVALLSQYRHINRSKLAVLMEIEDLLPIRPFRREEAYFENYVALSTVEQGIAALFAVVYVVLGVATVVTA